MPRESRFLCIDIPLPADSGVRVRACSDIPDVVNNFEEKPGTPLSVFSSPVPRNFQLSYICNDRAIPVRPGLANCR